MKKESIKAFSYRISQANRTELIVVMYDIAIEYLNDAVKLGDVGAYRENIRLAMRVIDRLSVNLDMTYELSLQLFQLYLAMTRILQKASTNRDDEQVNRVISMLGSLRKSFYEVSKTDTSAPLMSNTHQVFAGLTYSSAGGSNEYSADPVSNRGFMA